ncbi:MAG: hypothetical protein M3Z54_05000 [Gemmatimonadota bacterium]|nr:hypothetical protein [Gemmatimonadota bacterium]
MRGLEPNSRVFLPPLGAARGSRDRSHGVLLLILDRDGKMEFMSVRAPGYVLVLGIALACLTPTRLRA